MSSGQISSIQQTPYRLPIIGETVYAPRQQYYFGAIIGQGAFGSVYECTDEWSNALVAKALIPTSRTLDQVRVEWLQEINSLVHLRHPNITYAHDAFEHNNVCYLILERCDQTLDAFLNSLSPSNSIAWLPTIARDLLQGLEFIHSRDYVHKDLHAQNVFVAATRDPFDPTRQPSYRFKIGDLGISNLESEIDFLNTRLAQWMLPPEVLNSTEFGSINRQIDVYHVGLLLLRMLLGNERQFTNGEILDGMPRQLAEQSSSPFGPPIAKALRRHVEFRTATPLEFWREIRNVIPRP